MRSGIYHAVCAAAVRQILAVCVAAVKAQLQHLHAGITGLLHQPAYRGREKAQILGNDVPRAELALYGVEKIHARAGAPAAVLRGGFAAGDGIIRIEAPKMVDAQRIVNGKLKRNASQPPAIALALHPLPVEQRIAPKLAVRRKAVRRAARHFGGHTVFVQLKLLRVRPDVGAVCGNIDGQIADDADTLRVDIRLQRAPLAEKQILHGPPEIQLRGKLCAGLCKRAGLPQAQRLRPDKPRSAATACFQRHKQRVILQPIRLLCAKSIKIGRPVCKQAAARNAQHGKALRIQPPVIHRTGIIAPIERPKLGRPQQAVRRKLV